MSTWISDIRHGLRVLLRTPVFTVSTVLVLALGIGATTAVFGFVNAMLFQPLPYADADRLVMIWEHNLVRNQPRNVINPGNFFAWQERSASFEQMAILAPGVANLTGLGDPEELRGVSASANLLQFVGARPLVGRLFEAGEDQPGRPRTVIISEGLWRRRLGAQADAVGRTIELGGEPATVIGVLPASFELLGLPADVWRPLVLTGDARGFRGRGYLALALLKSGITRDQAQQEMEGIAAGLRREQPVFDAGWSVHLVPLREQLTGDLRPALITLFAAAAAVLLIACANLVSLLLARAAARHHELSIRAALGAGTGRLVRQLFTETALLVVTGGAVGLLLARGLQVLFVRTVSAQAPVPLLGRVTMDGAVIAFALGATGLTALLCGLWPALAARRLSLTAALRDGGRGVSSGRRGRLRTVLVTAEVAAAAVLLANAALMARSFIALQDVHPGFDPARVLSVRVNRSGNTPDAVTRNVQFHAETLDRLRQLPGVQAAAGTVFLPLAGLGSATSFWLDDRPQPEPANRPSGEIRPVTPGYFQTVAIPLLLGRDFDASDTRERPLVTIVNETFVRRFYPDENPLGRRVTYSWGQPNTVTVEIVGVVSDVKLVSLDGQIRPALFLPHAQRENSSMSYVLRTAGDPAALAPAAIAAIRELDGNQPISDVRPLDAVVARSIARPRITSTAIVAFALIALLLAVVGVYGVVAYGVSQRLPEFGVRLALGARPSDVLRLVLRQGMTMVGAGAAIGIALAIPTSAALRSQLFGIGPGDPLTLALTAAILIGVALIACYVPARRGAVVDPVETLRAQ